jgi:hypothetical protein
LFLGHLPLDCCLGALIANRENNSVNMLGASLFRGRSKNTVIASLVDKIEQMTPPKQGYSLSVS